MARKSRKQTAAPMPAPSLYVHVALYIRLSVEDNKKRGCSVENQKLVLNDFLSDKPDFVVYDTYIDAAVIIGLKTIRLKKFQKHGAF